MHTTDNPKDYSGFHRLNLVTNPKPKEARHPDCHQLSFDASYSHDFACSNQLFSVISPNTHCFNFYIPPNSFCLFLLHWQHFDVLNLTCYRHPCSLNTVIGKNHFEDWILTICNNLLSILPYLHLCIIYLMNYIMEFITRKLVQHDLYCYSNYDKHSYIDALLVLSLPFLVQWVQQVSHLHSIC